MRRASGITFSGRQRRLCSTSSTATATGYARSAAGAGAEMVEVVKAVCDMLAARMRVLDVEEMFV